MVPLVAPILQMVFPLFVHNHFLLFLTCLTLIYMQGTGKWFTSLVSDLFFLGPIMFSFLGYVQVCCLK